MLERTAGCLESGSLRHLLPGSKKALKSRRELHSGFWTHGAAELELSPLWAALIRGPGQLEHTCEEEQKISIEKGGTLLDFLYPAGTIRLLRQYSNWGIDRQDGRRSIAGPSKLGHRLYTSSAKEPLANSLPNAEGLGGDSSEDASVKPSWTSLGLESRPATYLPVAADLGRDIMEDASAEILRTSLGLERRSDYEEACRRCDLEDEVTQQKLRPHLISYLAPSTRIIDAERIVELFAKVSEKRQKRHHFGAAVLSHLRLHHLADASALTKVAAQKFKYPIGADHLLAYMFERSLWLDVIETWQQYRRDFEGHEFGGSSDMVDSIYRSSSRVRLTYRLADFIADKVQSPHQLSDRKPELIEFGTIIVRHLLKVEPISEWETHEKLLKIMRRWGRDDSDFYETYFRRLFQEAGVSMNIIQVYRKARGVNGVTLNRQTLHALLRFFCRQHSTGGMQQILNDFFRWHTRPSRLAYDLCMKEFASRGDADTVHALFNQYVDRFQPGTTQSSTLLLHPSAKAQFQHRLSANDFTPLLHVHAKRGELSIVLEIFADMAEAHNVQPNLMCWNIVLNAYGKLLDIDGAFQCFDELLETTDLQPDGHTFGTLMGICAARGDRQRAVELFKTSESRKVERNSAMIGSLVLALLRDDYFDEAEKLCEEALELKMKGSRVRIWNQLIVAYANRRDLQNVNRILLRMAAVKLDYDEHTYSALMQALCMVHQPHRAKAIMTDVMREAGFRPTNIHYAVLMGGYIANGEYKNVFKTLISMEKGGVQQSASTRLLAMKAAAAEDQQIFQSGTGERQAQRALEIFQDTLSFMDPKELSQTIMKGFGGLPRDIAYSTSINSFVIFILGQQNEFHTARVVYENYLKTLPESSRSTPPIQVLSALMIARQRARDFDGVQECWDMALSQARQLGRNPAANGSSSETRSILPYHQLSLNELITTQMISLSMQRRVDEIPTLIDDLLDEGFKLHNKNWNHYIQILASRQRYQLAFQLCEERLMPNWTGWARIRWQAPERNRLPLKLRNLRKLPTHYRPTLHTFLYLARGYLELQSMASESPASHIMLSELEESYPKTINAIRTMQRADNELERDILRDYDV